VYRVAAGSLRRLSAHPGDPACGRLSGIITGTVTDPSDAVIPLAAIKLTESERLSLGKIVLQVGASTESVTVVSQGTPVQTESSERSAVITSAQIRDLSSLSRSWTTYMLTIPSVYSDPGVGGSPSIAGQPASSNSINLDVIGGDAVSVRPPRTSDRFEDFILKKLSGGVVKQPASSVNHAHGSFVPG